MSSPRERIVAALEEYAFDSGSYSVVQLTRAIAIVERELPKTNRVAELEAQLDKLQKAALEAVSWDWRIISMMPEFVDWAAVIRDMDALEKALAGKEK